MILLRTTKRFSPVHSATYPSGPSIIASSNPARCDSVLDRIEQALGVFVHPEHGRPRSGRVATDPFKHAEAELHSGTQKRDHAFAGGPQRIIDPYVSGGHILLGYSWNLL